MTLVYVLKLLALCALAATTRALRTAGAKTKAGLRAVGPVAHKYWYVGEHRPGRRELSTMQRVAEWIREDRTVVLELPAFEDPAPVYPSIGDRYAHRAGVGRYSHLRPEALDAQIRHQHLVACMKAPTKEHPVVDLKALRVRGAVPTVGEVDDEWYEAFTAVVA